MLPPPPRDRSWQGCGSWCSCSRLRSLTKKGTTLAARHPKYVCVPGETSHSSIFLFPPLQNCQSGTLTVVPPARQKATTPTCTYTRWRSTVTRSGWATTRLCYARPTSTTRNPLSQTTERRPTRSWRSELRRTCSFITLPVHALQGEGPTPVVWNRTGVYSSWSGTCTRVWCNTYVTHSMFFVALHPAMRCTPCRSLKLVRSLQLSSHSDCQHVTSHWSPLKLIFAASMSSELTRLEMDSSCLFTSSNRVRRARVKSMSFAYTTSILLLPYGDVCLETNKSSVGRRDSKLPSHQFVTVS